jgi:hypothetical protein
MATIRPLSEWTDTSMDTANGTIRFGEAVRVIVSADHLAEGFKKCAGRVGIVEHLGQRGTPFVGMVLVRFPDREAPAYFRGVEVAPVDSPIGRAIEAAGS